MCWRLPRYIGTFHYILSYKNVDFEHAIQLYNNHTSYASLWSGIKSRSEVLQIITQHSLTTLTKLLHCWQKCMLFDRLRESSSLTESTNLCLWRLAEPKESVAHDSYVPAEPSLRSQEWRSSLCRRTGGGDPWWKIQGKSTTASRGVALPWGRRAASEPSLRGCTRFLCL